MEEYCVDLEIAKELFENGFPQKCKCQWVRCYSNNGKWGWYFFEYKDSDDRVNKQIDAPTSDEILKELPDGIKIVKQIGLNSGIFAIACPVGNKIKYFEDKKLSNALAKTWIYLKKEGYIK